MNDLRQANVEAQPSERTSSRTDAGTIEEVLDAAVRATATGGNGRRSGAERGTGPRVMRSGRSAGIAVAAAIVVLLLALVVLAVILL